MIKFGVVVEHGAAMRFQTQFAVESLRDNRQTYESPRDGI